MEILKLLEDHHVVKDYEVEDFRVWADGGYYKIEVEVADGTVLHAREYVDSTERTYSYHWQDRNQQMILRWDNAPHHPDLVSHPHHLHRGKEEVVSCMPPDLRTVLNAIGEKLEES